MPEFLCPITQEPCPVAQTVGDALNDALMATYQKAIVVVAELGHFATIDIRLDRETIDNLRTTIGWLGMDQAPAVDAISVAKNTTVAEMLPAFIACGERVQPCDIDRDNAAAMKTAVAASVSAMARRVTEAREEQ